MCVICTITYAVIAHNKGATTVHAQRICSVSKYWRVPSFQSVGCCRQQILSHESLRHTIWDVVNGYCRCQWILSHEPLRHHIWDVVNGYCRMNRFAVTFGMLSTVMNRFGITFLTKSILIKRENVSCLNISFQCVLN